MDRRTLKLLEARALSPSVRELTLTAPDQAPLPFRAGQFWQLYLPIAEGDGRRSYSIAAAPTPAQDRLRIAVTRVEGGEGSRFLHELPLGGELEADGPHGFFDAPDADVPLLFVAAGTGLSPIRAMLEQRLPEPHTAPLFLLFGCRTPADVLWSSDLERWSREHPRFTFEPSLSRPEADWPGRRGHVQNHVRSIVEGWVGPRPQVLICGLTGLVQDVRRVLKEELGYDRRAIHSERYD